MALTASEIESLDRMVAPLQRFNRLTSVSRLLTPANLAEERARLTAEASKRVFTAPEFIFPEPSADPTTVTHQAVRLLRSARDLPEGWCDAVTETVGQRLAMFDAAVTHDAARIHAASEQLYGSPTPALLESAERILRSSGPGLEPEPQTVGVGEAKRFFEDLLRGGPLSGWVVDTAPSMYARASVISAKRRLVLSERADYSREELERLAAHELGGHALRTENANAQPLRILGVPLGSGTSTEEGLALANEARLETLTKRALRTYALRALAAKRAVDGSFSDVVASLLDHVEAEAAVDIACRAKRGMSDPAAPGAHFKDISYLAGYLEVTAHLDDSPEDYAILMSVKQPMSLLPLLRPLHAEGLLQTWPAPIGDTRMSRTDRRWEPLGEADVVRSLSGAADRGKVSEPERVAMESWRLVPESERKSGIEVSASLAARADALIRQPLRLVGLEIFGDVDVDGMTFASPVEFIDCQVHGTVSARGAAFESVSFRNCRVGRIDFSGSRIGGDLDFAASVIGSGEGDALLATHLVIGGDCSAAVDSQGASTRFLGRLNLELAEISGRLDLNGAEITGSEKRMLKGNELLVALVLTRAKCQGGLRLRRARISGMVRAIGVVVGGQLNLTSVRISNPGSSALVMERSTLSSSVIARDAVFEGSVKFAGSSVDGALILSRVSIRQLRGGLALDLGGVRCQRVRLDGDDPEETESRPGYGELRRRVEIDGRVMMRSIRVEQDMTLDGLRVRAAGTALDLTGAEICGQLWARWMRLGAETTGPGAAGVALSAEALEVEGRLDAKDSVFFGDVNLNNVSVGSFTNLRRCKLSLPGARLTLRSSRFGRDLDLDTLHFRAGAEAVLADAAVSGTLKWRRIVNPPRIDLESARVNVLDDDAESWPTDGGLALRGFDYGRFADAGADRVSVARRIEWIASQSSFSPAPFERLAAMYRSQSNDAAAKQVMLALQRAHIRETPSAARRMWAWAWYVLTGYGYRLSGIAVVSAIVLALSVSAAFWAQATDAVIPAGGESTRSSESGQVPRPSECTSDYPCFDPIIFGIDSVVPVIELNQVQFWVPDRSTSSGYLFDKLLQILTILGWMSLSVVAGGLVQRMRS